MLVARTGLSPVMVGRAAELERLRRLLVAVHDPRVALVSGEAGVGKTRLVEELLAGLPRGTPVLTGHAEQGAMGRPFELLLEAVEPFVAGWSAVPAPLSAREEALCLLLAGVATGLTSCPDREFAAEELARAAVDLLRHLAGRGPAVVVFEDLHWADAESLALFGRLASAPALPVLLVGTYRPEDLHRGHLADLLAGVERQRSVDHTAVDRLRAGEVGELLDAVYGRPIPFPVAEALHRRTAGNPFFIEELLVAAGDAPPENLAGMPLPVSLGEAVLRHLAGLATNERRVVDAAAVLGQRIPFDLLAAVTGAGEDELIDVLRDLVGRGLVVEEDADVFSFRHALTREAVASRLLGRERRRLHEKALVALQELGTDDWAALAYHASGANRWDEMVASARAGAAHYLRTGSTYQALRLAELGLEEADDDLELVELAARAAWSVGLHESAIERAEHWRRLAEASDDLAQRCRALRLLARLRWEAGDGDAQRRTTEEALAAAEQLGPSAELVWAYDMMAEAKMLAHESVEAIEWADRALALADEIGQREARGAILVNKGSALMDLPDGARDSEALLLEGVAAAEASGDHLAALRGIFNLGNAAHLLWPLERAHALVDRLETVIERSGWRDWAPKAQLMRKEVLEMEGDLAGARAALAAARGTGVCPLGAENAGMLAAEAALAIEADDLDAAAPRIERSRGLAEQLGDPEQLAVAGCVAATYAARRGDLAGALALFDAALGCVPEPPAPGWAFDPCWQALHVLVRSGLDPVEGRRLQAHLAGRPPASTIHADPGWPTHVEGVLLEAEGRPADALGAFTDSLAARGRPRLPAFAADAHLGAARCLLSLGRLDEAREHAREAEHLLARWTGWRKAEADALRRRLGDGRTVDGPAGLTPREREVAALVAEGLTNGEIAKRLYISTKTASVHVSNILTKLGMSSRVEIAAWAARQGLAP